MPEVYAFRSVQYAGGRGDVSTLVSPPYDVLDESAKRAMLARDGRNIVAVDLPHTPAKELGPASAYEGAARTLRDWLHSGVMGRHEQEAMFAYRQTFSYQGRERQRCGMACLVNAVPFGPRAGGGVLPHEQTFSGPKEDRMALMRATRAQLSPVFGLHQDEKSIASRLVRRVMDECFPDMTAITSIDGVKHEVWNVDDPATIREYQGALAGEDIFIADGHHRYTTGLNYLKELEGAGRVPGDHPARRSMMVLVSMSDPGLVIGPTHRVLGGMAGYTIGRFLDAAGKELAIKEVASNPGAIENSMEVGARTMGRSVLGLIDLASGRCFLASPHDADPLRTITPDQPTAWRALDVAIVQHLVVERICQPRLNENQPVKWAFPHSVPEALEIGRGVETGAGGGAGFAQLAVIVRPTPLEAVREISRAGVLMPQKSTFFYPKLATGLFIHPLE